MTVPFGINYHTHIHIVASNLIVYTIKILCTVAVYIITQEFKQSLVQLHFLWFPH